MSTSRNTQIGLKFRKVISKQSINIILLVLFGTITVGSKGQSIISPDTIMHGSPTSIQFSATNISSYFWNFGDGQSSSISNPTHIYYGNSCGYTNLTITLEAIDSNGISNFYNKSITVAKLAPKPILTDVDPLTPFSNCNNSPSISNPTFNIQLLNSTNQTGSISGYTLNWGDNSSTQNIYNSSFPISHTYNQLGLFNITITSNDTNGCSSSTTYQAANQSNPAVGLSSLGSTQGCAPQEFSFILSQYQNNSPGTYYVWDFGDGSQGVTWDYSDPFQNDTIKHIFNSTSCSQGGFAFTVSVTAHSFCDITTATVSNIRIYSKPEAHFTVSTDTGCVNSTIQFTNNTISGFGYNCNSTALYSWDFGDGSPTTISYNANHAYQQPGIYNVVLHATNGVCGNSQDTVQIVINGIPHAKYLSTPTYACDSLTSDITNLSTGGNLTNLWTCTSTSGWQFINGSNAQSEIPTIEFTAAKNYPVKLKVTNNCGTDDTTIIFGLGKSPNISINSISNYCNTASINPTANTTINNSSVISRLWQFQGGSPLTSSSISPGTITYSSPGAYSVICSVTNSCGTKTDTIDFTIFNLPTINLTSSEDTVCQGDTVHISATGGINYSWVNNFLSSNQGNQTAVFSIGSSGFYPVIGTDINGCTNKDSIFIFSNSLPNVQISSSADSICAGDSINFLASGASSYTWSFGGTPISNTNQISLSPATSGYISLIGIDNNSCKTIVNKHFTVFNNPSIILNNTNYMVCPNDSISVLASGANSFTLTGANTNLTTNGAFSFIPQSPGIYQLIATNNSGCMSDTSISISIFNQPTISATSSLQTICSNDTIIISCSGAQSYIWIDSTTSQSFTGSTLNLTPNQDQTFWVFGTDSNGCTSHDSININVNQLPSISINSSSNSICLGNSMLLTAQGANSYSWLQNGQIVGNNQQIHVNPLTTTTYTLIGTDNNGCSSTVTQQVSVNVNPVISSSYIQKDICLNDTSVLHLIGATTYLFSPSNGITASGNHFIANPIANTTYQVIGINNNGCSDTISIHFNVHQSPAINITSSGSSICLGQSINLQASGGNTYFWTPNQNLNTSIGDSIIASPTTSTMYRVLGIDTNGCSKSDSVLVNVTTNVFLAATANPTTICQGDTVILTVTGASTYQWIQGAGLIGNTGNQVIATPNSNSNFIVTGTDTNGCVNNTSVNVIVNPKPNININSSSSSICLGDSIILTGIGGMNYTWKNSASQIIGTTSQIVQFPTTNETYTLVGSNSYNCSSLKTFNLVVSSPPTITLGSNFDTICAGSMVVLDAFGAQNYSWTSLQPISNPGIHNPTSSPTQSAWYVVDATNSLGCSTIDSIFINVRSLPIFSTNVSNTSICQGDSVNLSASGNLIFNWQPNSGLSSTVGSNTNASPSSSTIYTISGTDSFGCTNQKSIAVNVNSKPTALFSTDSVICLNSLVTLVNMSSGGANFSWNFGNNLTSTNSNPTTSYIQTGYYSLQLIASSMQNCSDTLIKFVQVIDAPTSLFSVYPNSGCSPVSININNQSIASQPTYNWSFGDGNNYNGFNPLTHSYSTQQGHDTSYILKLTTANKCGISEYSDTIIINSKPFANFGIISPTLCSPVIATFGNISSNNSSNFFWDFNDNTSSGAQNPGSHIFTTNSTPTTYNISLVASNQCGTDTITKQLTVNPNIVTAAFTPSSTATCSPATISFSNYSNIVSSAYWDFDDGNVSSLINPTHIYNTAGNYNVRLIVTDNCGIDTAFSLITISNPPSITFSISNDTICQGGSIIATNLTPGLSNTSWNFGDNNTSSLNSTTHSYSGFGVYSISLTGTDAMSNCSATTNKIIMVNQKASSAFTTNVIEGCFPLAVSFNNNSANANIFNWNYGDGNSSTLFEPQHTYSNPGNYNAMLIANNFAGCPDTSFITLKSYPHPTANFTFSTGNICHYPVPVNFTNQSFGSQGYKWIFDNGDSSFIQNPSSFYNSSGIYNPKLITFNSFGCSDTIQSQLVLHPNPEANFTIDTSEGCESLVVNFLNSSTNSLSYAWEFDDNHVENTTNASHFYEFAGNYIPRLLAYGPNGCIDTLIGTDTIKVFPKPDIEFDYIPIESELENIANFQFLNHTNNADFYLWDFGDGFSDTLLNPKHQFTDHGEFQVTLYAESSNGCHNEKSSTINIKLIKGLYIPNALAPNHPIADLQLFTPKGKGIKTYEIVIYDNWNNIIWRSGLLSDGEPVESWDGTIDGKPLKQGTYFWKATAIFEDDTVWQGCDDGTGKITRQGTITLLR